MKVAFSTLGCPAWEWDEIITSAKDLSYDGVEVRTLGIESYAPHMIPFMPENIGKTKARLHALGIQISCLTSSCELLFANDQKNRQTGMDYIDLAQALEAPYIRVMGDAHPQPEEYIDMATVADNYLFLLDYANGKNVTVLMETNGAFCDSLLLADFMSTIDHPQAGVLWDVHHPYRFCMESVDETYQNLKPYIRYLHMKDSIMVDGKPQYKIMGEGDIPNVEVLKMLKRDGFDGYVSLEWVKRWQKSLSEPGIVLPHFINYVQRYIK